MKANERVKVLFYPLGFSLKYSHIMYESEDYKPFRKSVTWLRWILKMSNVMHVIRFPYVRIC